MMVEVLLVMVEVLFVTLDFQLNIHNTLINIVLYKDSLCSVLIATYVIQLKHNILPYSGLFSKGFYFWIFRRGLSL